MPEGAAIAARQDVQSVPASSGHLVTFYEHDDFLVTSVVDFLTPALEGDGSAVAVAEPGHLAAIEVALASRGLEGLVAVDAEELIARIRTEDGIDPHAFEREATRILEVEAAAAASPPRVFGEMVAVLWRWGDVTGAIELEDRWNELGARYDFDLLCGYPLTAFDDEEHTEAFHEVCSKHTSVIPGESYSELSDPDEQRRLVAHLQQEATANANERAALRKKHEELEEALDRLRDLDRLRNEFTAMVVHDIKSPAAIAASYLDLLEEDWANLDPDEARMFVRHALSNVRRIRRLANDILTMSQIDSGEFTFDLRPTDLVDLVFRTVEDLRGTTGRAIEVHAEDLLRPALVDPDRQIQILTNLISNAVKFSAAGSPVRVTLTDDGDHLAVTVSDRGIGISESERATLFRPFSGGGKRKSVDGSRGSGLGLYIARALVEGQGGTLSLDSREGEGTSVTYTVIPAT